MPGVNNLAAIIIAELGDFKNFRGPAQIVSFAGLDTSVNQSGTMETRGSPCQTRFRLTEDDFLANCLY